MCLSPRPRAQPCDLQPVFHLPVRFVWLSLWECLTRVQGQGESARTECSVSPSLGMARVTPSRRLQLGLRTGGLGSPAPSLPGDEPAAWSCRDWRSATGSDAVLLATNAEGGRQARTIISAVTEVQPAFKSAHQCSKSWRSLSRFGTSSSRGQRQHGGAFRTGRNVPPLPHSAVSPPLCAT